MRRIEYRDRLTDQVRVVATNDDGTGFFISSCHSLGEIVDRLCLAYSFQGEDLS